MPVPKPARAYVKIADPRDHEFGAAQAHGALDDLPTSGSLDDALFRLLRLPDSIPWLLFHVLLHRGGNGCLKLRLFFELLLRCVLLAPCLGRWGVA